MTYRATIIKPTGTFSKEFPSLAEAGNWIDSENNNLECDSIIETFDDNGKKEDGFFYTEKAK